MLTMHYVVLRSILEQMTLFNQLFILCLCVCVFVCVIVCVCLFVRLFVPLYFCFCLFVFFMFIYLFNRYLKKENFYVEPANRFNLPC